MRMQRSLSRMLAWIAVGLVLFGLALFLVVSERFIGAVILALAGALAMAVGLLNSRLADCPVCGTRLTVNGLAGVTGCPRCLSWGRIRDGEFHELEPDYQSTFPVLALPIQADHVIPPLCCSCGAPASRTEHLRIIRLDFALDVQAPHCPQHGGGADLDAAPLVGKTGKAGKALGPVLKVKSYRFYQALAKINYPDIVKW